MKKEEMTNKKEKVEDKLEKSERIIRRDLAFWFTFCQLIIAPKIKILGKAPVTLIEIFKEWNFVKKSINDFLFTFKLVI